MHNFKRTPMNEAVLIQKHLIWSVNSERGQFTVDCLWFKYIIADNTNVLKVWMHDFYLWEYLHSVV